MTVHHDTDVFSEVKWIFFDIGSTLVDEEAAYNHRIMDMSAGTKISFEEADRKRIAFAKLGYDGNSKMISHFGWKKTPWHTEDEGLYPEAKPVLAFLHHKGYRLGVIANQSAGLTSRLEGWEILHCFQCVASSAEIGAAKPDPGIFRSALSMANCLPHQAVMVGDRLDNDIFPAKKLGMKTVWLRNGLAAYQTADMAKGAADLILDSLAEMTEYF